MITASKDVDDDQSIKSEDILERRGRKSKNEVPEKTEHSLNHMDSANMNGTSKSPSPRILKDVLADEVPQYKR